MFLSYATTLMFQIWEQGPLKDLPVDILEKAQLMLCNTIAKTLSMQSPDGSWNNGSTEITAYCVLILAAGSNSPFADVLGDRIQSGLLWGRAFLLSNMGRWESGEEACEIYGLGKSTLTWPL